MPRAIIPENIYPQYNSYDLALDTRGEMENVVVAIQGRIPRVAQFGDSRTAQGKDLTTGRLKRSLGWQYWATLKSYGRYRFLNEGNFGVSGDTTTMMLARIDPVLAYDGDACVILAGTNDWGAGNTYDQVVANLNTIIAKLQAVGKTIILVAELPRGDTANTARRLTGSSLSYHMRLREWCIRQAARRGIYVYDPWPEYCVANSTTGDSTLGLNYDGLHPSQFGARIIGEGIARICDTIFPAAASPLMASNTDLYDAANNIWGNLITNGVMDGTGGTLAAGVTGAVAAGWTTVAPSTGLSVVASKVTVNGKDWQQFVITGTPSVANPLFEFRRDVTTLGSVLPNDILYANCEIDVSASTGYLGVCIGVRNTYTTAGTLITDMGDGDILAPGVTTAWGGYMRTPPLPCPNESPSTSRFRFYCNFINGTAANLTVRIRNVGMRKF